MVPFKRQVMHCDPNVHIFREIVKKLIEIVYIPSVIISIVYAKLPDIWKTSGIDSGPVIGIVSGLIKKRLTVGFIEKRSSLDIESENVLAEDPFLIGSALFMRALHS